MVMSILLTSIINSAQVLLELVVVTRWSSGGVQSVILTCCSCLCSCYSCCWVHGRCSIIIHRDSFAGSLAGSPPGSLAGSRVPITPHACSRVLACQSKTCCSGKPREIEDCQYSEKRHSHKGASLSCGKANLLILVLCCL